MKHPIDNLESHMHQPSVRAVLPTNKSEVWLDVIKALALLWIFLNHVVEQIFGYPWIGNPGWDWPPLAERISQLTPLSGLGVWSVPVNALRYLGWFGDQGVQLFLIASGFGLTWGLLHRPAPTSIPLWQFYRRRAQRVYPLWWGAHLLFASVWLVTGWGLSALDPSFYLSLLGIRLMPALFYYFSPAWWYIGLLLQLYLVYPLLWEGLRRLGPGGLLLVGCAGAFLIRGIGLYVFEGYLDAWQRGAIFITRLPEFVFGISMAAWLHRSPQQVDRRMRSPQAILGAVLVYGLGIVLSLTLPGMIVAPFLLGAGAFVVQYALVVGACRAARASVWLRPAVWVGRHSYSLYLMHHPWIMIMVPLGLSSLVRTILGATASVLLTLASALALEWGIDAPLGLLRRQVKSGGLLPTVLRIAALGVALAVLLVGGELLTRRLAPQEVFGWGERPSLQKDESIGWHLMPSQKIRLRWESYDYWVSANALGFPGPDYAERKVPGSFRIMTTGDAFTSAEGVHTDQAWPRLLEKALAQQSGRSVEVLNFAITGYGPDQYAAVLEKYVPIYQPDLIILEVFVNDFQDVFYTNEDFRQSIGFDQPKQDGLYAILRLENLRRLVRLQVTEPVGEWVRGKPCAQGYFLGNFLALERNHPEFEETGQERVLERLSSIKLVAEQNGVELMVIMAPAPVQVCDPNQLAYYPRNVDLSDLTRYDLNLPQRMMAEITQSLGLRFYDLRPVLKAAQPDCLYQPNNMHWTVKGHEIVSNYLVDVLGEEARRSQ